MHVDAWCPQTRLLDRYLCGSRRVPRRRFESGRGDAFHSDHELCAQFGVSRATIRQALAALEAEGLLRRVQGFGTFVNRHKIEESFTPKMDFLDQWARSGRSLRVEILSMGESPCPQPFADHLGMAPVVAAREIAPEALAEHAVEKAPKDKPVVAGVSQ